MTVGSTLDVSVQFRQVGSHNHHLVTSLFVLAFRLGTTRKPEAWIWIGRTRRG